MAEDKQFAVQAIYANRARITFNPHGVRVTFGESPDGSEVDEQIRAAFFLTHPMFTSLVQLFTNVQAQIEKMNEPRDDN